MITVHKVTCFITRKTPSGMQLLLFNHPDVGVQIPAGTVNPGEDFLVAAVREAAEESGLAELVLFRELGELDDPPPTGFLLTSCPTTVYSRPDRQSNDWVHLRNGLPVEVLRHAEGYTQIRYEETNRYLDPQYTTYSIIGWVPDEALTNQRIRHFYLFTAPDPTPEQWSVAVDFATFELFWAPIRNLPAIVPLQKDWLKWLDGIG
jgi:8-oxo-dGTP pyrophosphatase MutT (NUDIX family)